MEPLLVSGRNPNRFASGRPAWLREALVAVLSAVVGHLPLEMLLAFALCITAVFALASGVVHAEAPRLVPDGQLESAKAVGVAVDQSTSDVFVAGFFAVTPEGEFLPARVNKFGPSGSLLSPPSPFGEATLYSGTAVNPVNGDVYALGQAALFGAPSVFTYDPATGELLGPPFSVPASDNFTFFGVPLITVVQIAADSAGNVYVPVAPENEVLEYDPATCPAVPEPCVPLKTFKGGSGAGALKGPTGVAVDPAGNVWVADTGNNRIEELSPAGAPLGEIASEGVGSVALDAHGDVFAILSNSADFCGKIKSPCSHLVEYSPAGAQLADLGAGSIGAAQVNPAKGDKEAVPDMVAVSDATGLVYVTEAVLVPPLGSGSGRVLKFRPPVAPTLEGEAAVEVGVAEAKLGAVVNPGGLSASYRFEYGTTTAYGSMVPFPEGDTGAGFTSRTVWAGASGLQPGTTYHYRAVVTGVLGEPLVGNDQTFTTETAAQAACLNEQFRTGFSAALPDCRSYELVTPPNKASAQPDGDLGGGSGGALDLSKTLEHNFAAADGSRLSFRARDVRPGSPSTGESYVATRGPGGWSEENMFPPTNYYGYKCPESLKTSNYSEDLSKAIILVAGGGQCSVEPELISGEPRGSENLFVRDNATGTYQLVNVTPEGVAPAVPTLLGASPDYSRIIFAEEAKLTPDAPDGVNNVYEWSAGQVRLVTVLPNGTAVAGSFVGISTDGSRVFFTAAGGGLYSRVGGAETVQLDASQAGGSGGGGSFQAASHDGSVVLFTDDASAELTSDTQSNSGTNLYRYDFGAPVGQRLTDITPVANAVAPVVSGVSKDGSIVFFTDDASAELTSDTQSNSGTNLYRYAAGQLTDLTPAAQAEVQSVLGVSDDGSTVYFKAAGELTSQPNPRGETAQSGQPNMYLSQGGAPTFIANGAEEEPSKGRLKVSANGAFFAFESVKKLTAYDNTDQSTGQPAVELYLYDAAANSLACASCNPSGEHPTAGGPGFHLGSNSGAFEVRPAHNLSENGRLFFDSAEGLLPADTNGNGGCSLASGVPACTDVYEFEPPGVGSCAEPAGCLYLISTGTGTLETFFIDASSSGNDVFIREYQKLVPRDAQDGAPSLYDVRVDGGFPEPPPPPPCTTADACRTAPAPLPGVFGAPASQTFSGAVNLAPPPPTSKTVVKSKKCKRGFVKKKGKCVKAKKARKAKKTNRKGSK